MQKHYQLFLEGAEQQDVEVFLLAGDVQSPLAGNKHLKLGPWLQRAAADEQSGLIGVGGVWSNFILSLALSCRAAGLQSTGIIRGEEYSPNSPNASSVCATTTNSPPGSGELPVPTAMLQDAVAAGMQLHYVSRSDYRQRADPVWQQHWASRYPGYLWVPEGGSDIAAAAACRELLPADFQATHWVVAAGTGATAAGIAAAIPTPDKLIVVNVSGDPKIRTTVNDWSCRLRRQRTATTGIATNGVATNAVATTGLGNELNDTIASCLVFPEKTGVRFGKLTPQLCELANQCLQQTGVLLDPVYTVKALQQVQQMIGNSEFPAGARVALIHTGGLQGWRGYIDDYRQFLSPEVINAINMTNPSASNSSV